MGWIPWPADYSGGWISYFWPWSVLIVASVGVIVVATWWMDQK